MLGQLIDGAHYVFAIICSLLIWGVALALFCYHHFSRNDFLELLPTPVINTLTALIVYIGTLPILNYMADKEQFGSIVGARDREMLMFMDRPWYGVGGYQFLIALLIILIAWLIVLFNNRR